MKQWQLGQKVVTKRGINYGTTTSQVSPSSLKRTKPLSGLKWSCIKWVNYDEECGADLDEAFELVVLCQELRLLLLQGEDVLRCLL